MPGLAARARQRYTRLVPLGDLTSAQAVEGALDEFDELGRDAFLEKYGFGHARRYFVRRDGKYYDSKAIAGAAYGFQYPQDGPLANTEFSGGEHGAKAKLEELGFDVVPRPALAAADKLPLREALATALAAQRDRAPGQWSDDLQKVVAVTLPNAIRAVVGESFRVKGSAGAGNQAEIPWVSVLPPGIKGASEGRYVVYLFSASGDRVYVSLSQAVTGHARSELEGLASQLRADAGDHPELLSSIDLQATGDLGQKYELATAYAIEYRADELPEQDRLESDLKDLLVILDGVLGDGPPPPPPKESFDWAWLVDCTNWSTEELEPLRDTIRDGAGQVVLAGPPGTSKTWVARAMLRHLTKGDPDRLRLVQFHPSYGYEDFIEGLRPTVDDDGKVNFRPVRGEVLQFVEDIGPSPELHFLLIDEMNRANLSRVFGELMYLFEYRDEEIDLRLTKAFRLPSNLRFIGTMNTADRSIRSIDIALRRRFDVFELPPSRAVLERFYAKPENTNTLASLFDGFEKLNDELRARLDRHHAIGHAFFMTPNFAPAVLRAVWDRKIGPLIEEYFFDQPDVAATFVVEEFWPELGSP
jgi:MrcB-like, N-terminal domain/AAA domain (dynein-related subfamily)